MCLAEDILPFIPQREPFVMVDKLQSCDQEYATTSFYVSATNLFVQNGRLKEPALIENIAQTAAAHAGYLAKKLRKETPVGFIGAVQGLKINRLPNVGDELKTNIVIKNTIFNATIIEGSVSVNDQLIASCEMRIFINQ